MKSKAKEVVDLELLEIKQESMTFFLVGVSPLIYNAMSEKTIRTLLLPEPKKNVASRNQTLKHDPIAEYRNSVYRLDDGIAPTRLYFPSSGFKKSMAAAALDIPGATRASIERLSWAIGDKTPIFGVPQLYMVPVRSADINRTPDIRTRAILPRWACSVRMSYVTPQLRQENVIRLFGAAGILSGIGDNRQGKGGGYGQFRIADQDDPELAEIVNSGGIDAQDAALQSPAAYDQETRRLYEWATGEIERRTRPGQASDDDADEIPMNRPTAADAGSLLTKARGRPRKNANGAALQ